MLTARPGQCAARCHLYLRELASAYHSYYDAERILVDDEAIKLARLALVAATAQVLANGLAMLVLGAPAQCKATTSKSAACDNNNEAGTILGFILGLLVGFGRRLYVPWRCPSSAKFRCRFLSGGMPTNRKNPDAASRLRVSHLPPWAARSRGPTGRARRRRGDPPEGAAPTETPAAHARASNDPLGTWPRPKLPSRKSRSGLKSQSGQLDGFVYFAGGGLRSQADADAQRAKLGLIGQSSPRERTRTKWSRVPRARWPHGPAQRGRSVKQQLASTGYRCRPGAHSPVTTPHGREPDCPPHLSGALFWRKTP